jgi:subtilisin family serine protease
VSAHTPPPEPLDGLTGRGVRVLVVDSGVDDAHPALAGAAVAHYVVAEADGGLRVVPAPPLDPVGHGTAVASIVRRHAPDAELTSVRVVGQRGRGTVEHLLAALGWAAAQGYDVINTSLGSTYLALLGRFKPAVDGVYVAGSVLVSACNNLDPEIIEYPAHFASVVSVAHAALPPLALERCARRLVEFRAAGVDVPVAWRDGATAVVTGSSFAAPHVAALVARLRERHPRWNATQVKAALYELARPAEDAA